MDKVILKQKLNKPMYGVALGLILPLLIVLLLYSIKDHNGMGFVAYMKYLFRMGTLVPSFSLTTLINLVPFYIFKRFEMWYINKGIAFSVFLYVILVVIVKIVYHA